MFWFFFSISRKLIVRISGIPTLTLVSVHPKPDPTDLIDEMTATDRPKNHPEIWTVFNQILWKKRNKITQLLRDLKGCPYNNKIGENFFFLPPGPFQIIVTAAASRTKTMIFSNNFDNQKAVIFETIWHIFWKHFFSNSFAAKKCRNFSCRLPPPRRSIKMHLEALLTGPKAARNK